MGGDPLIVWLDANANASVSSFRTKLTTNPLQDAKVFSDIDPCIAFLRSLVDKQIFFILSGQLGSTVIPQVYDYEHIHQIYLFCGTISAHIGWAMDYTDKLFMFDHEDDLLQRLFKDIELYLRQQADQCLQQAATFKQRAKEFDQGSCG